jgi:hypothetical protein
MSRDQLTTQQKFQALTDQRDGYQLQAEEVTRERDRYLPGADPRGRSRRVPEAPGPARRRAAGARSNGSPDPGNR